VSSGEIGERLNELLAVATAGVRPPDHMIKFYNSVGRIPLRMGVAVFLLTGIDTVKVVAKAIQGHTDAAIQVLYEYRFRPWRLLWGLGDHLWQMSYNCRSVRSRGTTTHDAISLLLQIVAGTPGPRERLTIISLGSGSARQMLHAAAANNVHGEGVNLILVDNDLQALERGRKNARLLGIEDVVDFRETTVGRFLEEVEPASVKLCEMVGLTDYFDDERFHRYLDGIHSALAEDGFFLGANISSREEASYAHGVACWPKMYYRPKDEIVGSIVKAGFKREKIWVGDCGLYTFWVAQKGA
jgi:cyclopropane fatty-acyl-phospholipid synthase-like methyltransferase